jgi:hypothetical protein
MGNRLFAVFFSFGLTATALPALAAAHPCEGIRVEGKYSWIPLDGTLPDSRAYENPTVAELRANGQVALVVRETLVPSLLGRVLVERGLVELRALGGDCRLVLRRGEDELIAYRVEYASPQGDLALSSGYGSVILKRIF